MLSEEHQKTVREIVGDELGCEDTEVTPDASLSELGADSLDLLNLTMRLEEEFEIEIPDEDAEKLKTVGDVFGYLESHLQTP